MCLRFWALGLFVLFAAGCKVEFDETMPFYCENDDDCGGGGFLCFQEIGGTSSYCCKDEGFNLKSDPRNCGQCGHVCEEGRSCSEGKCIVRRP